MKKILFTAFIFVSLLTVGSASTSHAESVRIQPLQNQTVLKKAEKKKGFVDITNPGNENADVRLYVNGFKQVDNQGRLSFFASEELSKGIALDFDNVIIGPRQTLRLYYVIDAAKLPTGDVFASIFADTATGQGGIARTAIRVGSLMMITNQTPGSRDAEISQLDIPFFQIGDGVKGSVSVKNPALERSATGYFPDMRVEVHPFGGMRDFRGPLIFAGNTRSLNFNLPSNQFGIYAVTVRANNATKTVYVFMMTGWWRIAAPILLIAAIFMVGAVWHLLHRRRHARHSHRRSRP